MVIAAKPSGNHRKPDFALHPLINHGTKNDVGVGIDHFVDNFSG
jgi:hypothetical protein